jgi:hypothetical protein
MEKHPLSAALLGLWVACIAAVVLVAMRELDK